MSASLDPDLERSAEKAVDAWSAARRSEDVAGMSKNTDKVNKLLKPELIRRFELVVSAIEIVRADPRRTNISVTTLVDEGLKEQWYQHTRGELKLDSDVDGPPFFASPETDRSPAAAGSRYQVYLSSAELRNALLLHDDIELQAEAIAAGDAFRGTIEEVWDEEPGKGMRPIWRLRDPLAGPMRLRAGSRVCVVGLPKRTAEIRDLEDQADGTRVVEIEIIGWKTKPDSAADQDHIGRTLTLVSDSGAGISRVKSMRIWSTDGPGAWLTHRCPGGPRAEVVAEAQEDLAATTLKAPDV